MKQETQRTKTALRTKTIPTGYNMIHQACTEHDANKTGKTAPKVLSLLGTKTIQTLCALDPLTDMRLCSLVSERYE